MDVGVLLNSLTVLGKKGATWKGKILFLLVATNEAVPPLTARHWNIVFRLILQSELKKKCLCRECMFEHQATTSINCQRVPYEACRFAQAAQSLQQREATWLELSCSVVCIGSE